MISSALVALALLGCSSYGGETDGSISDVVPAESSIDYALQFDGINDDATTGTARFPMPTSPQTISLWVKIASTWSDKDWVTFRRDTDSGNEFGLAAGGLPTVWRVYGAATLVQSSTALDINQWQFVAYVFDGTEHAIYVDGSLVGTATTDVDEQVPHDELARDVRWGSESLRRVAGRTADLVCGENSLGHSKRHALRSQDGPQSQ